MCLFFFVLPETTDPSVEDIQSGPTMAHETPALAEIVPRRAGKKTRQDQKAFAPSTGNACSVVVF